MGVFGRGEIKGFPSPGSQKGEIKAGSVKYKEEVLLDGSVWEDKRSPDDNPLVIAIDSPPEEAIKPDQSVDGSQLCFSDAGLEPVCKRLLVLYLLVLWLNLKYQCV